MAYSGATKILKQGGESLDKFEETVSQVSSEGYRIHQVVLRRLKSVQRIVVVCRLGSGACVNLHMMCYYYKTCSLTVK